MIIREIADEDNDIHLTINDGAHGSMMLKVNDANPFFSFKLKAESGWSVYSLTLNGEDVTAEMAADGSYTTPAINSNSTLNIVYSQGGTSVAALNSAKYMLSAQDGSLLISGTEGGERITVYTLDGKNVASATAQYGLNEVAVPANQTYIVKIDQQSFKVVVK